MLIYKLLNIFNTWILSQIPSVVIERRAIIDIRSEIDIKSNIHIGTNTKIYKNITIYKDKKSKFIVGSNSHIAPYGYFLMDKYDVTIGSNVAIGPFCSFFCVSNYYHHSQMHKDTYITGNIQIGNNVFIGAHSIILPGTIIEDNVVIAANSTVSGKLESGFLYGGNKAKKIKALS